MAEIIKQSWVKHIEEYRLRYPTSRNTAYAFPCDRDGVIDTPSLSDAALANLVWCRNSGILPYVKNYSYDYRHPAIIACDVCGGEVQLSGFTNTCLTCEQHGVTTDYNMSGQRLAPRSQWGEETGETAADILMGGSDDD